MKKNSIVLSAALLMSFFFSQSAFCADSKQSVTQNLALTVDGSALLAVFGTDATQGVENGGSNSVAMSLAGAGVAGAIVQTVAVNEATRLRISSLVENGKTRTITASILPNLVGSGTTLSLELIKPTNFMPAAVNGGTTAGPKDMTDGTTQTLVSGITTCWSGTTLTDGYTIKYTYAKAADAVALISRSPVVTFTISEQI
jgi:hypothetical protein